MLVTASFRAASCSSCVSTSSPGNWTYRTTDPRMKQFLTDLQWTIETNWNRKSVFLLHPFVDSSLSKDSVCTYNICGYFSVSLTLMSVNFMLRYWSTECSVPQMLRKKRIVSDKTVLILMSNDATINNRLTNQAIKLTSGHFWAPQLRLFPPTTWRTSRITENARLFN